jgi:hypothetical protein
LAGVLVSLQFIVYGFHRLALGLAWMLRGAWLGVAYVGSRVRAIFIRDRGQASAGTGSQAPAMAARAIPYPVSARVPPAGKVYDMKN